jgi:hypothetical protein
MKTPTYRLTEYDVIRAVSGQGYCTPQEVVRNVYRATVIAMAILRKTCCSAHFITINLTLAVE